MEKLVKSALLSLFMVSILFACSEKDDEEVATSSKLVGKWTFSTSEISMTINDKSIKEFYMEEGKMSEEDAEEMEKEYAIEDEILTSGTTLELTADNKYYVVSPNADESDEGTWKLSTDGKILIMDNDDEIEIKTSTSSKLTLAMGETDEFDLDNDGDDDVLKTIITLNFKK